LLVDINSKVWTWLTFAGPTGGTSASGIIDATTAMQRLSDGDVALDLPAVVDRDELGDMARSLEVFRRRELERRGFAARQDAEQVAQRERTAAIEQMIAEFRAKVTSVIVAVTDNLSRMETTARALSGIADEADNQARAVSSASETASSNARGRRRHRGTQRLNR
jgi:methyl-accepting chemotaxis protein